MNLDERVSIEIGIVSKQTLKNIAAKLGRHTSSISNEIKNHRIFIPGNYYAGNDCKYVKGCNKRFLCGDTDCHMFCYSCTKNCHDYCDEYKTNKCNLPQKPPYVCNGCSNKRYCTDDKYFYEAKRADSVSQITRKESRKGIRVTDDELNTINSIIKEGIKKGQPLSHIFSVHEMDLPITSRTAYTYIDKCLLETRNVDLRRQASYKHRRKRRDKESFLKQNFRQGRTYTDFEKYMENHSFSKVFEMDTVKGKQGLGKVMLTMMFRRNSVMLIFLMPDCKAESVIRVFDYLEAGLGLDCFKRLFNICLTDNGSEFKKVDELELSSDLSLLRTNVFFCDPMASGQKGRLEKNHEYIRYVIPKGKSFNPYTQEDMVVLMNNINSTKRPGLGFVSPYDTIPEDDEDMHSLMRLLGLHKIPAEEVNLSSNLFKIN